MGYLSSYDNFLHAQVELKAMVSLENSFTWSAAVVFTQRDSKWRER